MKIVRSAMLFFALSGFVPSVVLAAELLDVKPVVAGSAVSIEISANIAMTYTYYTIPGQARAVVDIAEVDPEKVEPLIVVNKGVVASISVDKAQISGIAISRIIFNLVSESDISVSAAPDRKLLTVTFGARPIAGIAPEPPPEPVVLRSEPVAKIEAAPVAAVPLPVAVRKEEALPGHAEPAAETVALVSTIAAVPVEAPLPAVPESKRILKLEPVVPVIVVSARPLALTVKKISVGKSSLEILTNQPIGDYKATIMTNPERLVIDMASAKINQKPKSVPINKLGITKARIGVSPKNIRIVIDSNKAGFPEHTISVTEDGLRIDFKQGNKL